MATKGEAATEPVVRKVSAEEAKRDAEAHAKRVQRATADGVVAPDRTEGRLAAIAKLADEATDVLALTAKFVDGGSDVTDLLAMLSGKITSIRETVDRPGLAL